MSRFQNSSSVWLEELLSSNTEFWRCLWVTISFEPSKATTITTTATTTTTTTTDSSLTSSSNSGGGTKLDDQNPFLFRPSKLLLLDSSQSPSRFEINLIMLSSVFFARVPGSSSSSASSSSPLTSSLLCCLVSLLVWTVAVVGLHHVRLTHSHMAYFLANNTTDTPRSSMGAAVASKLWQPQLQLLRNDPLPLAVPRTALDTGVITSGHSNEGLATLPAWPWKASYRMDWSTEDNYQVPFTSQQQQQQQQPLFCGSFADIRQSLDHSYHKVYTCQRQLFQDKIIESKLALAAAAADASSNAMGAGIDAHPGTTTTTTDCDATKTKGSRRNWIVFTAGVMGAGKSFTIRQLHEKGRFPLQDFVTVDPDSVRRLLPEFEKYVQVAPEMAGELTRKESGMISEILTEAALRRGQNVLVDGTLRNSTWYQSYFENLRERYPTVKIGILHVTAPREAVLKRALSRAKVTGRVVPRDLLEHTMLEVPRSIESLSRKVDFAVQLQNAPGSSEVEIVTEGINWTSFTRTWRQSCAPPTPARVAGMDLLSFERAQGSFVKAVAG